MNDRDIQLASALSTELRAGDTSLLYLVSTKYTNIVRVNLVILKALLDGLKLKGIVITVDRPHQYLSHLLQLHGVGQDNLSFIDAIAAHASDTKPGGAAVEYQHGPFHVEALPEFLRSSNGSNPANANFSEAEFVLIDNVSTMLTYNTLDSLRVFLIRYVEVANSPNRKPVTTVLVMDKDVHAELHRLVSSMSWRVVELSPEMTVRQISDGGAKSKSRSPDILAQPERPDATRDRMSNDGGVI